MLLNTRAFRQMMWVVTPMLLSVLTAFSASAGASASSDIMLAKNSPATNSKRIPAAPPKGPTNPDFFSGTVKFTTHEFRQFKEVEGQTRSIEIPLAPKAAIKLKDREKRNDPKWVKSFGERHNGVIDQKLFGVPIGVDVMIQFYGTYASDTDSLTLLLNELLKDPDVEDVSPVFYVDNREALVTGIDLTFIAPITALQLKQMFYGYGEMKDLSIIKSGDGPLGWTVEPKDRLFTLPANLVMQEGSKQPYRRFDMHLLLLANLLESQQLFKGVPIKSARPIFVFLEQPLSATMTVDWGSETIGALRRLIITVVVPNKGIVIFDPKDAKMMAQMMPQFGTGRFSPDTTSGEALLPGWLYFADEKGTPLKKNPGWSVVEKTVRSSGRTVTVYEFTQFFYVFQPETEWRIPEVGIRYQVKIPGNEKPQAQIATIPSWKFFVFSHAKAEDGVLMPTPAPYAPTADVLQFLAPPQKVLPGANTHPFATQVAKWGEQKISVAWISSLALGLLLFLIGSGLAVSTKRKENALKPKPLPFMAEAEFAEAFERAKKIPDVRNAITEMQRLATAIIVARLPHMTAGSVTKHRLKEVQLNTRQEYPGSEGAYVTAVDLFDHFAVVDAPDDATENLLDEVEKIKVLLPRLYRDLSALEPKMVTAEVPNGTKPPATV